MKSCTCFLLHLYSDCILLIVMYSTPSQPLSASSFVLLVAEYLGCPRCPARYHDSIPSFPALSYHGCLCPVPVPQLQQHRHPCSSFRHSWTACLLRIGHNLVYLVVGSTGAQCETLPARMIFLRTELYVWFDTALAVAALLCRYSWI